MQQNKQFWQGHNQLIHTHTHTTKQHNKDDDDVNTTIKVDGKQIVAQLAGVGWGFCERGEMVNKAPGSVKFS